MATDQNAFKFPDEKEQEEEKIEVSVEGDEIEVVDDTPEEDRNRTKMKEPPADVTDEELAQYSEGVRQRIQHFSKGYHEERRAKETAQREKEEAIRLAQTVLEENNKLRGSVGQNQAALLEQAKKVVASEYDAARKALKEAHENFDTDAIVSAQEALTSAKIKMERVNSFKPAQPPQQGAGQQPAPGVQPQPRPETPAPALDPKVEAWQNSNPWFGQDRKLTAYALAIHQELVENGYNTSSDDYYDKINAEMRSAFPKAFPSGKAENRSPARTPVAPASRSTAPRKIVLTQSQVNIAKRLNVPLQEYARQVAAEARKANA